LIANTDAESTASTKSSTFALKVLSVFAENNSVPVYRYIQVVFFVVIACCLGANLSNFLVADLEWDNTGRQKNPITDIIHVSTLQLLTVQSLNNFNDFLAYRNSGPIFNATRVNDYSSTLNYYENILNVQRATY
jgi:hypothetical protein